jgi:hypothetical protein
MLIENTPAHPPPSEMFFRQREFVADGRRQFASRMVALTDF